MGLYFLFCCEDCNRIGRNAYYKINDKGRLRNERWSILFEEAIDGSEKCITNLNKDSLI